MITLNVRRAACLGGNGAGGGPGKEEEVAKVLCSVTNSEYRLYTVHERTGRLIKTAYTVCGVGKVRLSKRGIEMDCNGARSVMMLRGLRK